MTSLETNPLSRLIADKKIELVLTSWWPKTLEGVSHVFIAPWCFIGEAPKAFWEITNEVILPLPPQIGGSLDESAAYVSETLEIIFPLLADFMNTATEQHRSIDYWKTILYHWVLEFTTVYYERFLRLHHAMDVLDGQSIHITLKNHPQESETFRPENYADYYFRLSTADFNLQIFSDIIESSNFSNVNVSYSGVLQSAIVVSNQNVESFKATFKNRIKRILLSWAQAGNLFYGNIKGFEFSDILYFGARDRDWRQFFSFWNSSSIYREFSPRNGSLEVNLNVDPFRQNLFKNISKYIPRLFFRAYEFPRSPRYKAFVGNDIYDEPGVFWLAENIEKGVSWISVQHGGGYGTLRTLPMAEIEYHYSQGFVTWGWTHQYGNKKTFMVDLPSPFLSRLRQRVKVNRRAKMVLYVSTCVPMYAYRFDSCAIPEKQMRYFKRQQEFFLSLPPSRRKELRLKRYVYDFGLSLDRFYGNFFDNAQILPGQKSLIDIYAECRLIINDNLNTSFLESLAVGVPTLLFIDEQVFPRLPETDFLFSKLKAVGIYHTELGSLNRVLESIWDEPFTWWDESERQRVVKEFLESYARTSAEWKSSWTSFFHDLQSRRLNESN